jgi:molybdenum cofactor biosynthesis protein B
MRKDMSKTAANVEFIALGMAVITISDSRTPDNDGSGDYLAGALAAEGHRLVRRRIVRDDRYVLRAEVSALIADPEIDVILTTGSTGLTGRDVAPEALEPLFDKAIGSPGACRTAWEEVIRPQLDSRTRPCNLATLMPRFLEK